jgi:hypothetical protein
MIVSSVMTQASPLIHEADTIDNWQVFYGEDFVAEGNANGQGSYLADTILYQPARPNLLVYYNSDAVYARERIIQIWQGESLLSTQIFKESEMYVDLREALIQKTKSNIVKLRITYLDKATGADHELAEVSFLIERDRR